MPVVPVLADRPAQWDRMSWSQRRRYQQRLSRLRRLIPNQVPEVARVEARRLQLLIEPDAPDVIAARQELLQQITAPRRKKANA